MTTLNLAACYLSAIADTMKSRGINSVTEVLDGDYDEEISNRMVEQNVPETIADSIVEGSGWAQMRTCHLKL